MSKLKKIILLFISTVFLFSGIFNFIFAVEVPLPGWDTEAVEREELMPEYVRYIFNFSLMLVGLIAFGVLVYAGFCYLTSAGNPTKMSDALDRILAAFLGLIIVLGAYLILVTIDPQLVIPRLEPLLPVPGVELIPGTYLIYQEDGEEKFFGPFLYSVGDLIELRDKNIERIKIVNPKPPAEFFYGAILHASANFTGDARIYRTRKGAGIDSPVVWEGIEIRNPHSLTIFRQVEEAGADDKVVLCPEPDFKGDCKTLTDATEHGVLPELGLDVWSINIDGDYLLLLYGPNVPQGLGGLSPGPYYAVFQGPRKWYDLKEEPMNQCGRIRILFWSIYKRSCATHYALYPIL